LYVLDKISSILAANNQLIDLNEVDQEGNTLLHLFLSNPFLEEDIKTNEEFEVLEEILTSLATKENLNMKNTKQMSPMDLAKISNPKLVRKLEQLANAST